MEAKLKELGYSVTVVDDPTFNELGAAMAGFVGKFARASLERVKVVVYVSGHGCSIDGEQHVWCADKKPYGFQVGHCKLPHVTMRMQYLRKY